MLKHIKTRKKDKQKDLKETNERKEKEKVKTRYLKEKLFKLDFDRFPKKNLFTDQ